MSVGALGVWVKKVHQEGGFCREMLCFGGIQLPIRLSDWTQAGSKGGRRKITLNNPTFTGWKFSSVNLPDQVSFRLFPTLSIVKSTAFLKIIYKNPTVTRIIP